MDKASPGFEKLYSFNGSSLSPNGVNNTIFMQGLPGLNYLVAETEDGTNPQQNPRVCDEDHSPAGSQADENEAAAAVDTDDGDDIQWERPSQASVPGQPRRREVGSADSIREADEYKVEFYRRQKLTFENNKASNREKEKLFLERQEKFHAEANKTCWKAIAELIPNEVPTIEKGKKEKETKKDAKTGMGAPLATVAAFTALLFTVRGQMESLLRSEPGAPLTVNQQIIAGAGAGVAVSFFLACPTELIKCRLQAQSALSGSAAVAVKYAEPMDVARTGPVLPHTLLTLGLGLRLLRQREWLIVVVRREWLQVEEALRLRCPWLWC